MMIMMMMAIMRMIMMNRKTEEEEQGRAHDERYEIVATCVFDMGLDSYMYM